MGLMNNSSRKTESGLEDATDQDSSFVTSKFSLAWSALPPKHSRNKCLSDEGCSQRGQFLIFVSRSSWEADPQTLRDRYGRSKA